MSQIQGSDRSPRELQQAGGGASEARPSRQRYLDSSESLDELVKRLPESDQAEWHKFGHLRVEPAFQDRLLAVYQACGKDHRGEQRAPKIHSIVRVISFVARDDTGCVMRIENQETGETMEVGHIPRKLFGFPIFIAVPPLFTLRWDLREHRGKMLRSLSYLLFLKARNKAEFFSKGNYYAETPNHLRDLYPGFHLELA